MDVNKQPQHIEEDEAYRLQMSFIENWKDKSDTRFLRYGTLALSVLAATGGVFVSSHYRSALKLRSYGLFSSYAPLVLIPAASVGVSHQLLVVRDLLVFETACPICVNMRAVGIQMAFSVLLPVAMGTVSNFHLAERRLTYPLPTLVEDWRLWAATWRRLSRPLARPLGLLAAVNAIAAAFVTHWEASEFYTLLEKHDRNERWKKLNLEQ